MTGTHAGVESGMLLDTSDSKNHTQGCVQGCIYASRQQKNQTRSGKPSAHTTVGNLHASPFREAVQGGGTLSHYRTGEGENHQGGAHLGPI